MTLKALYNWELYNWKSFGFYKYIYKTTSIYKYINFNIKNPFYRLII